MTQEINREKKIGSRFFFIGTFVVVMAITVAVTIFMPRFLGSVKKQISTMESDDITFTTLSSGGQVIDDKTGGYSFILPLHWYLEKKEGSGIAVYPDYAPDEDVPPKCKIETSLFKNISANQMNDWVTDHIHEDPTVTIVEKLRSALSAPGAQFAFEWKGTIDGIVTVLAYIAANGNVYEIAPSAFDITRTDGNTACDAPFQSFLASINFKQK